jgi:hypothetical protein
MNKTKQLWALFKFQTTINPALWFMPLAFGLPIFLPMMMVTTHVKNYHSDFFSLFMNQNIFFVGIFGVMVMAPERFQYGAAGVTAAYSGGEFLLTRAIDRFVLYRSKAALLFILVLLLPLISILISLGEPDLVVDEYSKVVRQECLAQVPGSALVPDSASKRPSTLVAIPRGNVLVAEWQFASFLITALALQLLILLLYPLKFAKWVFWAVFFGLVFVPSIYAIHTIGKNTPSTNERLFFWFAAHPALFWGGLAIAFVLCQLWCERRYAALEQ